MRASRVRIFDMTGFKANIVFEFGLARGAELANVYAIRRRRAFGDNSIPTMMNNIDMPQYTNTRALEAVLTKALERHFWPTDKAFTEEPIEWLAEQIRELTFPSCEADKLELAEATGIHEAFVTRAINQFFVANGDALALGAGPAPRYRFDFKSIRGVPTPPNARSQRPSTP